MDNKPVIVERTFNAPVSRVWKAITDIEDMKEWYFSLVEFKPEVGFEFEFHGGEDESNLFLHKCRVTEVVEGEKLTYSWRYDGYEGDSLVTFELTDEGNRTKLKLTHEGLETFPQDTKDFAKENFAKGWDQIINISLKEFLEK